MFNFETSLATEMVAAQLTRQHAAMDGHPRGVLAADQWLQAISQTGERIAQAERDLNQAKRASLALLSRHQGDN